MVSRFFDMNSEAGAGGGICAGSAAEGMARRVYAVRRMTEQGELLVDQPVPHPSAGFSAGPRRILGETAEVVPASAWGGAFYSLLVTTTVVWWVMRWSRSRTVRTTPSNENEASPKSSRSS